MKLLPLLMLLLLTSQNLCAKSGPHERLESLGFTLLQGTPIDFELPTLSGEKRSLQSLRGKWILLAFWATWCGPCTEEMPQLEVLYREYRDKGLSILGVSVDQDRSSVEAFQREKKLSFPVLLDASNAVSSKYRASALPTLYVISSDWKLVGILRGARDWSSQETRKDLEALLKFREYKKDNVGIKMAEEDGALSLPNNLAPPEILIPLENKSFKKGEKVPLEVLVKWKDNPKDYLIKVPKITLPEGVTQIEVTSSSSSTETNTSLFYRFTLKLEKEGSHKVGPIELAYSPRSGGKELFSLHPGFTLEAKKENWARVIIPILGGLVVIAFIGIFVTKRKNTESSKDTTQQNWSEPFEKVRQLKMKGQKQPYMTALLKLNLQIGEASGEKNLAAASLLEKVQFGGYALSEAELTSFEKQIERAIKSKESV